MRTPFLFLLLALISGILYSNFFHPAPGPFLWATLLLFTLCILIQCLYKELSQALLQTCLLILLCFFAGTWISGIQREQKLQQAKALQQHPSLHIILGEYKGLQGRNEVWTGYWQSQLSYSFQLYLDSSGSFHTHDILIIPRSGNQWNFCCEKKNEWLLNTNYLAQAFIQQYVKSKNCHIPNRIVQASESLQHYTIAVLREHLEDQDATAIAISMILGQRTEISPALQNAYKQTGTIHILAVSGMHVALLHQALLFLTAFSGNYRKIKIVKNIVSLFILWFYALLTGFSASVIRAAAMFTLVLIASSLNRKDKGLNNLCAAAFVLLCIDTRWLYDYGFLLSVSAVAGIFLFNPFGNTSSSGILNFIKQGTGVSIAAQAGTLPISLYMSRSFPLYFLIANLILIPLSSLALYLGLALLLTHHIPILNSLNAFVLEYSLIGMNVCASYIAQLPSSLIFFYPFTQACAYLMGFTMMVAIVSHYLKRTYLFLTTLAFICLFICITITRKLTLPRPLPPSPKNIMGNRWWQY